MKTLLFIDATIRPEEESRTWRLCQAYLETWKEQNPAGTVEHVRLRDKDLRPYLAKDIQFREEVICAHTDLHSFHSLARCSWQFANADQILIGAPYWDLSFPALLRVYLEKLCTPGVTFCYTERGVKPLCKASGCTYLTTCGGKIRRNLGAEYIHELCDQLFGIKEFCQVSAEGLDMDGADVEHIMAQAEMKVRSLVCEQQNAEEMKPSDDKRKNGGETR